MRPALRGCHKGRSRRSLAGHPHADFQSIDPLRHCIEHYRSLEWGGGASKPAVAGTIDYPALALEQGQLEALFDREYYISMYEDIREAVEWLGPFNFTDRAPVDA